MASHGSRTICLVREHVERSEENFESFCRLEFLDGSSRFVRDSRKVDPRVGGTVGMPAATGNVTTVR